MKKIFSSSINRAYLFRFLVQFHLIGGVLVPFFTEWGGLTLTQTLIIQSWYVIWAFFLEIPTGVVADRIGRKHSLYLGALIGSIACLVYSSVPMIPVFLFAEVLFAASFALFTGADEAFLYDTLKEIGQEKQIKKVLARYESFGLAGLAIAAPIGSLIASYLGPRYSLMFMAIPIFLAFLIGLTLKEPKREKSAESSRYLEILKKGLKIIKARRKIQRIILDLSVVHSISFLMVWLYQPRLTEIGINIGWFGLVAAVNTVAQILIMNSYPLLEKKFKGVEPLLTLTALIPAILFITTGVSTFIPLIIVGIILTMGTGLTRKPLVSEELNQMIPSQQRATVLSAVNIGRRLGAAFLNPVVGKLADWSIPNTFVIIGLALLSFSIFRFVILSSRRRVKKSSTTN